MFLALRLMAIPVFDLSDFSLFEESVFKAVNIANALLKSPHSTWCERILCSIDKSLWVAV